MEHEFVPGKRRCQGCGLKWNKWNTEPCFPADAPTAVPPEPEKPPQVWHLNVWTTVNGVIFTGSHQYVGPDVIGWATTEAVNKVKEIVAGYTAKETE